MLAAVVGTGLLVAGGVAFIVAPNRTAGVFWTVPLAMVGTSVLTYVLGKHRSSRRDWTWLEHVGEGAAVVGIVTYIVIANPSQPGVSPTGAGPLLGIALTLVGAAAWSFSRGRKDATVGRTTAG